MYRFEGKTREKSKVISGETSLKLLAEERVCNLHILGSLSNQDDDGDKNVTNLHI